LPGLRPYMRWFRSYLEGRQCYVSVGGASSATYSTTSGVHQGSNLGPVLFSIFINDLPDVVESDVLLFADDVKVYGQIRSTTDAVKLQRDLDAVADWGLANGMALNLEKCAVITFGSRRGLLLHPYSLDGESVRRCDSIKDLGVVVNSSLKFKEHVQGVLPRAFRTLGMIRSFSSGLPLDCYLTLFKALVRPIMEYGVPAWNSLSGADAIALERVQRVFVRTVYRRYFGEGYFYSYEYISKKLLLPTLAARRSALDTKFVLKALTGEAVSAGVLCHVHVLPPERRRQRVFYVSTPGSDLVSARVGRVLNEMCWDPETLDKILEYLAIEGSLPSIDALCDFLCTGRSRLTL